MIGYMIRHIFVCECECEQIKIGKVYETLDARSTIKVYKLLGDCVRDFIRYGFNGEMVMVEILGCTDEESDKRKVYTNKLRPLKEIATQEVFELAEIGLKNELEKAQQK